MFEHVAMGAATCGLRRQRRAPAGSRSGFRSTDDDVLRSLETATGIHFLSKGRSVGEHMLLVAGMEARDRGIATLDHIAVPARTRLIQLTFFDLYRL